MSIKIGSRIFVPHLGFALLTLVVLVLLVSLGRWQLRRAGEKQALIDAFAAGGGAATELTPGLAALPRYQRVSAHGRYDAGAQILIDNIVNGDGRVGYFVITPFALQDGGWILVNRGWVPAAASRAVKPEVAVGTGERVVRGRTDRLPSPGIRMGTPAPALPPFPVVATFPQTPEIRALLPGRPLVAAAEQVLLDPGEPDGYVRNWTVSGFPPLRHLSYAVTWFALALTLIVIYVVTNLRPAPRLRESAP